MKLIFLSKKYFFSLFSGFAEQSGNIGIILELVIDQTVIVPYCYRIITLYSVWLSGSELYRGIFVKSVKNAYLHVTVIGSDTSLKDTP